MKLYNILNHKLITLLFFVILFNSCNDKKGIPDNKFKESASFTEELIIYIDRSEFGYEYQLPEYSRRFDSVSELSHFSHIENKTTVYIKSYLKLTIESRKYIKQQFKKHDLFISNFEVPMSELPGKIDINLLDVRDDSSCSDAEGRILLKK